MLKKSEIRQIIYRRQSLASDIIEKPIVLTDHVSITLLRIMNINK